MYSSKPLQSGVFDRGQGKGRRVGALSVLLSGEEHQHNTVHMSCLECLW